MKHAPTAHIGIPPRRMRDQHFDSRDMTSRIKPKKRPKLRPAKGYAPGNFSRPMRKSKGLPHGFPPHYQPHLSDDELLKLAQDAKRSEVSTATAEAGKGHAGRDMGLPGSLRNGGVKTMGAA